MNLEIIYSKKSVKFLEKNQNLITESDVDNLIIKAVKKILKKSDENIDLVRLKGYKEPHFRIRFGNIRIVFYFINGEIVIVNILDIDYRGNIYEK